MGLDATQGDASNEPVGASVAVAEVVDQGDVGGRLVNLLSAVDRYQSGTMSRFRGLSANAAYATSSTPPPLPKVVPASSTTGRR